MALINIIFLPLLFLILMCKHLCVYFHSCACKLYLHSKIRPTCIRASLITYYCWNLILKMDYIMINNLIN
ncbi:hypothetical protein VNO80_29942 [Phaseolus coccineus]|uniref:Uncharacterized protein n=1 Tax=Phaseolus coccineus TaxID=3886 RepID=A0AAN9LBX8_PHACN